MPLLSIAEIYCFLVIRFLTVAGIAIHVWYACKADLLNDQTASSEKRAPSDLPPATGDDRAKSVLSDAQARPPVPAAPTQARSRTAN